MNVRTDLPLAHHTLGDLVTADSRAAMVLEKFGLDYCCGGGRTLEAAARARGLDVEAVVASLTSLGPAPPLDGEPLEDVSLDRLVRQIIDQHHDYVRSAAPAISAWLERLVDRHGDRHPELAAVQVTFAALAEELLLHMLKEEHILFPAITELAKGPRTETSRMASPFGSLANPVGVMERDHDAAGAMLERLRALTGGYASPADGCTTYRLCYSELERFERDLHRHVHLENNVLFPRALALEQSGN